MNLKRAAIGTLVMVWVCTLWPALADGSDAVVKAVTNLVLFTVLVGAVALLVRHWRLRK